MNLFFNFFPFLIIIIFKYTKHYIPCFSFILLMAIITSGKYIKSKLSLCHNPSLLMKVFEKISFCDITNKTKKNNPVVKQIMLTIPMMISLFLKERIRPIKAQTKKV